MEDPLQNRLNMTHACLLVANSDDHKAVWQNNPPLDFGTDIATLQTRYDTALATAAKVTAPIQGTTAAKADAETILESRAYLLSRALCIHFKKTGDTENLGKVNYTEYGIRSLRHQDLVSVTKVIRDCGTHALTHADAGNRGITAAKVTALTTAITDFEALLNAPRAKIVERATLNRELVTQVAECITVLEDLDDLVLQFAGTTAGDHLIAAWQQARLVIDAGHGPGDEDEPPPSPPTP